MASNTDKLTDTRNAARPNSARVTSPRSAAGATLACDNLAGWPTASKVHFVTYTVDSNSVPVAGTQLDCTGIVSANNITSLVVKDGNDLGNSVGDYVEMLPTAAWGQDLADALTTEHNRSGTHKNITTDTITVSSGTTLPAGDIGTVDIATGAVTNAKLGTDISPANFSNPYKFSVYRNAALTSSNSATAVAHDTKLFDTGTNVDVVTNKGRFTAPVAGFYYFNAVAGDSANITGAAFSYLYKNGSLAKQGSGINIGTNNITSCTVSGLIQLAANDYVEHYFIGGSGTAMGVGSQYCYFEGFLVSAT